MSEPTVIFSVADPHLAAVRSGNYQIDPTHTRVLFSVSHFGFSTFFGEFSSPQGGLRIDLADLASSLLWVSVPVANITTGNTALDAELRSAEWLDSDRFPMITLEGRSYRAMDDGAIEIHAQLDLHGVTRPVVIEARFVGGGANPKNGRYTIGFDVRGSLRRGEFGVSALPLIGNELGLIISAALELKAPAEARQDQGAKNQ